MRKLLLSTTAIVVLWVSPALAGPLVTGIGALMSTAIGTTGATVGSVLGSIALSLGSSYLFNALFGPETKQRGVKQDVEFGGGNPPNIIVGTYATPGILLYENILDKGDIANQCLVKVIGLSAMPVKGIRSEMLIQDEWCNANLASSWPGGFKEVTQYIKGAGGGGYCLMKFHDGTQTSVDSWLIDKFGDHPLYPIHEDCAWRGYAYVIIQCWYSNRGIWTGLPEFKFVVEGIPLYDPRKDSSVGGSGAQRWNDRSTWSQAPSNAKVIEYNIIRGLRYGGKWQWGGNADAYRLPLDYWFAAMNACDEDIELAGGGTAKRGHIGAEIGYDDDPREIINEINKSVSGFTTLQGGFYKTFCGLPGLSVMTITDDDFVITEEAETELYKAPAESYNTAYSYWADPRRKWEMEDGPVFIDEDALEADGIETALDVQAPFVTSVHQLKLVMRAMVKDSQRQVTHRGQLPPEAYVLEPFDRITFISAEHGYAGGGKAFMLQSKEDLQDMRQEVVLREINLGDRAWLPEYTVEDSVGAVGNIIPAEPNLDFVLTPDEVTLSGGKERPAIMVTWPWAAGDTGVIRIYWKVRAAGTTKTIASGDFRPDEDGEHLIVHPALRYARDYEIALMFAYDTPRIPEWGDWDAITMVAATPPLPASLTAVGRHGRIVLKATKSADKPFDHFNVYGSDTNDFSTAVLVGTPKSIRFVEDDLGNGATRYYWITEVNRWGVEGPKFPTSSTGGRVATTTTIDDGDLDDSAPNVPTVPVIATGAADSDDDGKQEALLTFSWSLSGSGAPAKYVELEVWRSSTIGGTYTRWREWTLNADKTSKTVWNVNTKYFYKAKVKGISFKGKPGTFSALTTTGVKPTKRALNLSTGTVSVTWAAYRKKHVIKVNNAPINSPEFSYLEIRDKTTDDLVYRGKADEYTRMNPPSTTGYKAKIFDITENPTADFVSPGTAPGSGNSGIDDIDTTDLVPFCVTANKMADNAVVSRTLSHNITDAQEAWSAGTTTNEIVQTLTVDHGDADHIMVWASCINLSGSVRIEFDVSLELGDGTTISSKTMSTEDDGEINIFAVRGGLSGSSTTVRLRVATSWVKAMRRIIAVPIW